MRFLLIAVFLLLFSTSVFGQDSNVLSRSIDSSAKKNQQTYEDVEDSLYRLRMERNMNEKGQELDKFLADYEERKEKEKQQTYIRIGVGIVFLSLLIYGLVRRRKKEKNRGT